MAMQEISPETFQLGQQFYNQGMAEYGKIVYGETEARTALLAGFVGAGAVLLSGVPGGAKSTLSRNAYRIFEDIDQSEVSIVPPASDLQPIQLVGGAMDVTKTVITNGATRTESTTITVDPIIPPETKVIWLDELSRINPEAVNQLLGAPEERELKTTAGVVSLKDLQLMVSTMNPSESRQATFPITAAFASRHSLGAIMGDDISHADKAKLANGQKPNASEVTAFTNTGQLATLREAANAMLLQPEQAEKVVELVEKAETQLYERYGIEEAARMFEQVGKTARILALFEGGNATRQHVERAVKFALAARLGAKVAKRNAISELTSIHSEVVA
jgi:MoxR-like ATPase